MAVQGIGGVFLYATDVDALAAWYSSRFGLVFQTWGSTRGLELPSADVEAGDRISTTTFALFRANEALGPKSARINLRVADLDATIAALEALGEAVERQPTLEYGRFAEVRDPEGNRIELWEPPPRPDGATPMEVRALQEDVRRSTEGEPGGPNLVDRMADLHEELEELVGHVDRDNLREEIGDLGWSLLRLCNEVGVDFGAAVEATIAKHEVRRSMKDDHTEG